MKLSIAAISGSLRSNSVNTQLLHSLAAFSQNHSTFHIYNRLDRLPFFNQEHDHENVNEEVKRLRDLIGNSDGVVICTPEYAFGIPGVLKNALDWLVSSGELYNKPVLTVSASPTPVGGDKAHESLRLTLTALGAEIKDEFKITIASVKQKVNGNGEIIEPLLREELSRVYLQFSSHLIKKEKG